MTNTENTNLLTASKVCNKLGISSRTLDNWYKFYNNSELEKPDNMPALPEYEQATPRTPRYWKPEDIKQLKKFKEWVPKGRHGVMGRINEMYWPKNKRKSEIE